MTAEKGALMTALEGAFEDLRRGCDTYTAEMDPYEIGIVTSLSTGIAIISGLPNVGNEELVSFSGNRLGMAFNVDEEEIGVILLCDYEELAGDEVRRTFRVMDIAVGEALLGRVIDPLAGRSMASRPSSPNIVFR